MQDLYNAVDSARADYAANPSWDNSQKVKAALAACSAAISSGAKPCAACGSESLHGMRQPTKKGHEYEIGCLECGHRVRGGLLPRHAVEAWNERR